MDTHSECLVDTSAWVTMVNDEPGAPEVTEAVGDARLVTSAIVLAELGVLARMGRLRDVDAVRLVEERARLETLTREDAATAAVVYARVRKKPKSKLGLADALIYATARRVGALYVTLDTDLDGEPGVRVVGRKDKRRA